MPPISCGNRGCDPSVNITINCGGSGGGGSGSALNGTADPNEAGITPTDTSVVSYYEQQTVDGFFFRQWKWNPTFLKWA